MIRGDGFGSKSVVWTGGLPFPVLPREADCLAARRDFAFSPISAASQPFLLRALSYMRDLPRERAVSQQIGVDGGGSKNRDVTLDPLKRGQASQPGHAIVNRFTPPHSTPPTPRCQPPPL